MPGARRRQPDRTCASAASGWPPTTSFSSATSCSVCAGAAWSGSVTVLRFDVASAAELRIDRGDEIVLRERTMSENGEVVALASSYFARSLTGKQ